MYYMKKSKNAPSVTTKKEKRKKKLKQKTQSLLEKGLNAWPKKFYKWRKFILFFFIYEWIPSHLSFFFNARKMNY